MEKLLIVKRGEISEREHFGYLICADSENILYKNFDKDKLFYLRSCAKPLQTSVVKDLGVFEKFNLTPHEIAVISSSHSGTKEHIDLIKGILDKIGLDVSALKCGVHPPLDKQARHYLIKNDIAPDVLHNNCSGKHAGFLAACVLKGWSIDNYLDFNHPLQKMIEERINNFCKYDSKYLSKDGCEAPIMAMPVDNMCLGFAKCFMDYPDIKNAFKHNPDLIGGAGRIDTEIIRATQGRLIAKVGAEGLCQVFNTESGQVFAVKILDSNMQARSIVLVEALKQKGWISETEVLNNPLSNLCNKAVKTICGDVVGEIAVTFQI